MIARFLSDDAGRVLDAQGTRDDDGRAVCPGCHYGHTSDRDDGLCLDCGASADLHELAGDDVDLDAVMRAGVSL